MKEGGGRREVRSESMCRRMYEALRLETGGKSHTFFNQSKACQASVRAELTSDQEGRARRPEGGRTSTPRSCLNLSGWISSDFCRYLFLISFSDASNGRSRTSYGLDKRRVGSAATGRRETGEREGDEQT
jgi:hypothetical protein